MDPRKTLVDVARRFIGVHEEGGDNHGPMVERFQKEVDGKAQGEPWCMCFVQYCVAQVGRETGVWSNLYRGESCLQVWERSPIFMRRMKPEPGMIIIWKRAGKLEGHAGVVVGIVSPTVFQTVEGNTTRGFGIEREGEGVYLKERTISGTQLFLPVGFLQPF